MRQFIALADLHAHPWAAFAKGSGAQNSRFRHTLDVLRRSLEDARGRDVPWVFAGDLVHTAGYALNVVKSDLLEVFGDFPEVEKIVVWGNHDGRGVGGRVAYNQTVWPGFERAVAKLVVLDSGGDCFQLYIVQYLDGKTLTFSGAGAQPRQALVALAEEAEVGVYHGIVKGTEGPNGYRFDDGFDVDDLYERHVVSVVGDLHHPQMLKPVGGGKMILIPGSPEHHNFGDRGKHGWWLVDVDEVKAEFVPSESPEFLTVDVPDEIEDDYNYYRVRSVPAGTELPETAVAIAPAPTVVQTRNLLRGLETQEALQVWLKVNPPDSGLPTEEYFRTGRTLLGSQDVGRLRPFVLKSIRLRNFLSYSDQELLIEPGVKLVLGQGRDYPSNGAGKSSLFEAVFWLLFGQTTKGLSGDEVISRWADECVVDGVLQAPDGQHSLALARSRVRGGAHRLVVKDEEGQAVFEAGSVIEATKQLGVWLGLTPELFKALGYFSQERLLLFASASDGQRKEMLADLVGLAGYQAAASYAQACLDDLEKQARDVESRLGVVKDDEGRSKVVLDEAVVASAGWEKDKGVRAEQAKAALVGFEAGVDDTRAELLQRVEERLAPEKAAHEALRGRISALEALGEGVRPLGEVEEEVRAARKEQSDTNAASMSESRLLDNLSTQLEAAQHQYRDSEIILGQGQCPTCRQNVTVEHREKCLAPERRQVEKVEGQISATEARRVTAAARAHEAEQRVVVLEQEFKLAQEMSRREELQEQLRQLERAMADVRTSTAAAMDSQLQGQRQELKARARTIESEANPYTAALSQARDRLQGAKAEVRGLEQTAARVMDHQTVHEYWKKGFSRQGIQSLLMEEVAAAFNATRGTIFPTLTQGVYDVQLSTQSTTKAGELRERTELKVYEHGVEVPYEATSGGQRRRVDLGVMLTLVKAVSAWMQVPGALGLLVLDEVYGFLDAAGDEGLAEVLSEVQEQIPSVFTITQDPQLQALFADVMLVVQDEAGVSRIES